MVTQKDIAEKCNVSTMTVSLALRNSPLISEQTRETVKAAAREMGYRPNPLVSALMANRRGQKGTSSLTTLAYISPLEKEVAFKEAYLKRIFTGVESRVEELGFVADYIHVGEGGLTQSRLNQVLLARGVRGLMIMPNPVDSFELKIDWENFVGVQIGRRLKFPRLHHIESDQSGMMCMVLLKLIEMGYKRIGWAASGDIKTDDFTNRGWTMAYLAYQQKYGLAESLPICEGANNWDEGPFLKWVKEHKPDVVVSRDQFPLKWLKKGGYRVPEDIGFVCMNIYEEAATYTGITQSFERLGQIAVDTLQAALNNNDVGPPDIPRSTLCGGNWQEGDTIRQQ